VIKPIGIHRPFFVGPDRSVQVTLSQGNLRSVRVGFVWIFSDRLLLQPIRLGGALQVAEELSALEEQ
jgi:hypothetical protein